MITGDLAGKNTPLVAPLKSAAKIPLAKIQGWCSTNFALVLLRGADGAVWMHDSVGLVVSLYPSP